MKIGKSDLNREQLKKLLEAAARQEKADHVDSLDEEQLFEEEQRLQERLQKLASEKLSNHASKQSGPSLADDQLRGERNLQAIKQRMAGSETTSLQSESAEGESFEIKRSRRWVQISSFLAVAALLAVVVRNLPEHTPRAPIGPAGEGTRFKGQEVDVTDCDYSVLQGQSDLVRLEGMQTRFIAQQDGGFDVVIKCIPATGFVQAFSVGASGTQLLAKNMQIESSQRQFLRVRDADSNRFRSPFWVEGASTRILLFLTLTELGDLDESLLPSSLNIDSLGDQDILWADDFLVIMDGEETVE